jgi:hypothetical protein
LKLPSTYWVKRTDNEAVVGCFTSGKTWRLVCKDTIWIGEVTNCSDDVVAKLTLTSAAYHTQNDGDSDDVEGAVDLTSSLPTGALPPASGRLVCGAYCFLFGIYAVLRALAFVVRKSCKMVSAEQTLAVWMIEQIRDCKICEPIIDLSFKSRYTRNVIMV